MDIDVIFDTLKNDIPPLLEVIKQMKNDIWKRTSTPSRRWNNLQKP
jgi:hypothetical protein